MSALGEGLDELGARDLAGRLGEVEEAIRSLEAVAVAIVAAADRGEVYREDGHVSVRGWVKASIRTSDVEVGHRVRAAKLVTVFPQCGRELAVGRLGVAQVRELARAHANPRCGAEMVAVVDELVHLAEVHPHETFVRAVRQWERIADVDGAHDDAEHAHRGRRARIGAVGDTVYLDARVGTAQGATMVEVFEQFARAEFAAEWDDLRRRLGDEACPGRLARTEAQRRADALAAIFEAAATSLSDARRSEPVVNILIDQAVYEAQLAAMVGDDEARPDPADLGHQRCRTTSGVPVDPADAVAASVVGWVRRVVVDGDGLIINLGRRSRVFTGFGSGGGDPAGGDR